MKIVFTQVTNKYYAVFTNREHYTEMLGHVTWDDFEQEWEFFPNESTYFSKEEFNLVNNFLRGLEDLHTDPALDVTIGIS